MPLLMSATQTITKRLPKLIDARTHAVLDYVTAGAFFALGAMFWGRNKPAAIGALTCGGAITATSMLTDYPGGVVRRISFRTHGRMDVGLAGLTAGVPNFLAFADEDEAKYFRAMALMETVITGLTDFDRGPGKVIEMPARTA